MIRLIGFLLVFAIFLVFIVLNLDNKSDVSLGFRTFENAPVYITAFVSFFIGMICAIPIIISIRKKKNKTSNDSSPLSGADDKTTAANHNVIPGENGPYGIY